jgi:hypothetical protein
LWVFHANDHLGSWILCGGVGWHVRPHQMYYIPSLVGSFYSFVPSRGHCGNMMFMEFLLNFCKRALSICFFLI